VEKVLESEPPRRLAYVVVKGIPVRNYRAEVTLRPEGEGTCIRWSATWDRTIPGRIVHWRLRSIYPDVVHRLITAADRKVPAHPANTRAAGDGRRCGPRGRRGLAWLLDTVANRGGSP
jgi:hypothetical protein